MPSRSQSFLPRLALLPPGRSPCACPPGLRGGCPVLFLPESTHHLSVYSVMLILSHSHACPAHSILLSNMLGSWGGVGFGASASHRTQLCRALSSRPNFLTSIYLLHCFQDTSNGLITHLSQKNSSVSLAPSWLPHDAWSSRAGIARRLF